MKIGQVHALLREEFPDIELSKIRYYEDKGLVAPSRTRKGYRVYSDADVACLREAFRLASQEFVPLRIIRQRLISQGFLRDDTVGSSVRVAAKDVAGSVVSRPVSASVASVAGSSATATPMAVAPILNLKSREWSYENEAALAHPSKSENHAESSFSTEEFMAATGLSSHELAELREYGFVAPRRILGEDVYKVDDVEVARATKALSDQGISIRNLAALRRTVTRQVDLTMELAAPLRASSRRSSAADSREATRRLARQIDALRSTLLERALKENFDA